MVGPRLYTELVSDPRQITPAEFQLVEILWETSASLTVSQVREALDNGRRPAYTTVMTLLDKLARKGSLSRVKKGKAYHYRPAVDRDAVLRHLLGQFADAYFGEVHTIQRFLAGEPLRSRTSGAASRKGRPRRLKETGEPPSSKNEGEMDVVLL